jgi:hypothetical protein
VFGDAKYHKVIVVWNTEDTFILPRVAEKHYGIEIMGLRGIIHEFTHNKITSGSRDDVLRVLELVSLSQKELMAFRKKIDKL